MAIITVGFNQVGQFDSWYDEGNEETRRFGFEMSPPFQRFTLSAALSGVYTAWYYRYEDGNEQDWAYPCLYGSVGNKPHTRLTKNEQLMDIRCPTSAQRGWVSATMEVEGTIPAGSVVWFGLWSAWVSPRYSAGGEPVVVYNLEWWDYADVERFPPEPVLRNDFYEHDIGAVSLSLYFTYSDTPPAVVYTRKAVMSEGITDSRRFWRRLTVGVVDFCSVVGELRFKRLLIRLCSVIARLGEVCAAHFLFYAVVRTAEGMWSHFVHKRILERAVAGFAAIWQHVGYKKPLCRVEVRLFSAVCTQITMRSRI